MQPDDQEFLRQMTDKLAAVRAADVLPEELVALVELVAPLQRSARAAASVALPGPEAMAGVDALFQGSPLILRADFPRDTPQALGLFRTLLAILAGGGGPAAKAAAAIQSALDSGELDPAEALHALALGDDALFAAWRLRLPESPRALDFLTTSALWPGLSAAALALAPRLPENLPHHHGHCPLCGSLPFITFLHGKEGQRLAACSFCGHEYRIRRICCPYCDEGDTAKLRTFRVEEYPDVSVNVCQSCNMYSKILDFRESGKPVLAALDDMATVALDVLAQGHGHKRPTLSAWGF